MTSFKAFTTWRVIELIESFIVFSLQLNVVYFDQQTHACACIRMVENDQKQFNLLSSLKLFLRGLKTQSPPQEALK